MLIVAHVIVAISTMLAALFLYYGLKYLLSIRRGREQAKVTVRQPEKNTRGSWFFILCYIVILVLVFLPADYFNERQKLAFSAMLFVLVLVPSWWNSVSAFNWELEIFDDCFIHTDALGKKRRYRYDETEIRKPNKDTERVYVNGKYKFSIRCLYLNFEGLQKRVKHYKEKQQREQSSNERKETQQRVND